MMNKSVSHCNNDPEDTNIQKETSKGPNSESQFQTSQSNSDFEDSFQSTFAEHESPCLIEDVFEKIEENKNFLSQLNLNDFELQRTEHNNILWYVARADHLLTVRSLKDLVTTYSDFQAIENILGTFSNLHYSPTNINIDVNITEDEYDKISDIHTLLIRAYNHIGSLFSEVSSNTGKEYLYLHVASFLAISMISQIRRFIEFTQCDGDYMVYFLKKLIDDKTNTKLDQIQSDGKSHHEKFESIEKTVGETNTKLDQIQYDVDSIKEDFGEINTKLDQIQFDVQTIKEDVQTIKENVQTIKEDVQIIKEDVQTIKEDVQIIKESLQYMDAKFTDFITRMTPYFQNTEKEGNTDNTEIITEIK